MRFARLLAPLFLASIVAAGAVASSPGVASASGSGSWTQFHYAATRSGYDPLEKTLNPGNVGRISVRLQATFSGSVYDTPLVSGGRIFVSRCVGQAHGAAAERRPKALVGDRRVHPRLHAGDLERPDRGSRRRR
jgi:hypothetical protein